MTALALGVRYFAGVFAAGFLLGTVRTMWLAPVVGDVVAVAVELPLMLGVSFWWCRRLLAGRLLAGRGLALAGRVIMGGSAFGLLMLAELGVSLALGRSVGAHLAAMLAPAGLLGLAGQLVFAVVPIGIKVTPG